MRFCRPASRALSHFLRHEPSHHHASHASFFSHHSPLARAFDDPFFHSPFSSPLYTVYEVREDDTNSKQEEAKAAEPQQREQEKQDSRLARHEDNHRQRWLDRRSRRSHRHHSHHSHHPLSLFSPFESLFASSPFQPAARPPLEMTVDMYSTPAAYQVHAAIPGVRKEDIKLTVDDGVLTIQAERREERGRPSAAKAVPAQPSSTSAATSSQPASAQANATQAQGEQKPTEAEVKADGAETSPAAEAKAQDSQPQQQQAEDGEGDDVSVHHQESYYGRVQRSLQLPEDVNVEGLTARYENGVLRIELPRVEEKKQEAKQINIL